jgi:hypothetical protein
MSTRSETLATKPEQTFSDLLAAVEASTPEEWTARCADGEWTQGFAAFHAAKNIGAIADAVKNVADGNPFPGTTMDEIDATNAADAKAHAGATQAETVDLIKGAAPGAVSMLRSLTDDQLDRKVKLLTTMPEVSVAMMAEMGLIGHLAYHTQTITGAR